jgi:lysophospholipase L1-like esterase
VILRDFIDAREPMLYQISNAPNQIFKEEEVDGKLFYTSDIFPVRYYADVDENRNLRIQVEKTEKTYRIFVLGGSSAAGSPWGYFGSFSRFLRDALISVAREDVRIETVNLAVSSGSTWTARFLLDRLDFLEPDLIIVYAGHNEGCGGSVAVKRRNRELYKRSKPGSIGAQIEELSEFFYDRSYAYRFFSQQLTMHRNKEEEKDAYDKFASNPCKGLELSTRNFEEIKLLTDNYHTNLEYIASKGRSLGSDVLFVSQVANHFHIPQDFPGASKKRIEALSRLQEAFRAGDPIDDLAKNILEIDATNPVVHYFMALKALENRHNQQALTYLELATEHDRVPWRYKPSYGDVLASLSKENRGVYYVDIRSQIDKLVEDGIVDGRIIIDTMHPMMELNRFIAQRIYEDYFNRHHIRTDIFDHKHSVTPYIYDVDKVSRLYGVICKRYYQIEDWSECVEKALTEYQESLVKGQSYIDETRRRARVWENIFYYGLAHGDKTLIEQARALVKPWKPFSLDYVLRGDGYERRE